ncbi:MAG TPA: non-heme iron oxygenase ferredoxin subunit [Nitrososphaeraceae archaeon]|jgi:nitrite reductase/ring-hydroxylating ferredoxin subunit
MKNYNNKEAQKNMWETLSVSNQRNDYFRDACKADEVPEGSMKHVEVDGREILIAKVDGKFYAIADRCGHMNALLSMGHLEAAKNKVTCGFHGAQFDIITGQKLKEPRLTPPEGMDPLPEKLSEFVYKMMNPIRTYDQERYEVKVEDNMVKVK